MPRLLLLLALAVDLGAVKRPNILFVYTDDQAAWRSACPDIPMLPLPTWTSCSVVGPTSRIPSR